MVESANIQITERDVGLLREINRYGYADASFISKKFHMKLPRVYRRLRKLTHHGYLKHTRFTFSRQGVYSVTHDGVLLIKDVLPVLRRISQANCAHQLAVLHASLALTCQHNAEFLTERILRHQLDGSRDKLLNHLCDGVLLLADKKIAIEVELTHKSKRRIHNILNGYRYQVNYDQVWYLCGDRTLYERFKRLSTEYRFLRVFLLSEVIDTYAQ